MVDRNARACQVWPVQPVHRRMVDQPGNGLGQLRIRGGHAGGEPARKCWRHPGEGRLSVADHQVTRGPRERDDLRCRVGRCRGYRRDIVDDVGSAAVGQRRLDVAVRYQPGGLPLGQHEQAGSGRQPVAAGLDVHNRGRAGRHRQAEPPCDRGDHVVAETVHVAGQSGPSRQRLVRK